MPWKVQKSSSCPASKPWAVVNQTNGHVEGCHPTKERATQQQRALYRNVPAGASITGVALTQELQQRSAELEKRYLEPLVAAYEKAIRTAGDAAATQFALTAAAEWQPPTEGAALTALQLAALAEGVKKATIPIWRKVLVEVAAAPLARIGIAWDVKHPLVAGQIEKAAQRVGERLGEAVQPILRKTIADAYEQGLNVRDTAANIRAAISDAAPWQADMLARSDLNSLANGASKAAATLTGMQFKTWFATLDEKTRPEHADAHGQSVPINAPFDVGGEDLDFPGDPAGSDAMILNCRCSLGYGETLDEANALLADGGSSMSKMTHRQRAKRNSRLAAQKRVETKQRTDAVSADIAEHSSMSLSEAAQVIGDVLDNELKAASNVLAPKTPSGMDSLPTGVRHCTLGGTPGFTGGGLCRIHDGTDAGMQKAIRAAQADARKKSSQALLASVRPLAFAGTAAIEGKISDDNSIAPRVLLTDSLSWPEMPVPFMAQTVTAEGHDGAEVSGRVDEFSRKQARGKMRDILFSGELTTPFGINEIAPMIEDKTLRYVSVDLGGSTWSLVDRKTLDIVPEAEFDLAKAQDGGYALGLTSAKVKAVTLVPTQALEGAMVALTAAADRDGVAIVKLDSDEAEFRIVAPLDDLTLNGQAITAAAAPANPPRGWFETPEPPGKMPLTVSENSRVFGHLATWESCHVGFLPSCVPPPKSKSNYARFHVGELDTEEGDTVWVGKLMFSPDGGHANRSLSASKASQHYDKTGMVAAYLRVVDGQYGIWACGSLNPALTDKQRQEMRRELRLNPPSGDWRPVDGEYELICALAVAVPGFPVPRATITVVASAEGVELQEAIIASSGVIEADPEAIDALEEIGLVDEELLAERKMAELAARADWHEKLMEIVGED